MTDVATAVVERLVEAGVRRAYTVPGESFLPLLDACDRHPRITLVSARHESGAGFMAEADAKLTGRPALAMATRGVGAANLAIGMHTARQDSTPVIALLGQVGTGHLGREAFQEVDLPAFYAEITKWAATVHDPARLPEQVDRALRTATTGRPGPTMLALPEDVLGREAPGPDAWRPGIDAASTPGLDGPTADAIARILTHARRPVVIAGGGARDARDGLVALAEAYALGVYAAFRRQDVFPNDHPAYLGHLTLGPPPETLEALRDADVVLVLGSRLSEVTTQGYTLPAPEQRVLQVDPEPASVGAVLRVAVGAVADVGAALDALLARAPAVPPARDTREGHGAYLASSVPPAPGDGPIHPAEVMGALARTFPASAVITNDAGNFAIFAHRYWRFTHPRTQAGPTSGAMGYGVPAAVGAQLARPDSDVVALVGDGGFLMTGQELETAVRHDLPITVVAFRNGLYGTIALHQGRRLGRTAGVDIGAVDLAAVARGYGAAAWRVTDRDDLDDALHEARACGSPALVDVLVDPDVLSPTARLSDLVDREDAP
jgi:acetolactate synthase I/II/III large subunit